jgi:hypothetical protein
MLLSKFLKLLEDIPRTGPKGCQEWPLGKFNDGYGGVSIGGVRGTQKAHRVSLSLKLGRPLRENMLALHTCDNKGCVCRDHLYEGTHSQNSMDALTRGQYPKGARHGTKTKPARVPRGLNHGCMRSRGKFSKLSDEDILEIGRSYLEGNITQATLATRYGVSRQTVQRIVRGKSWKLVGAAISTHRIPRRGIA